MITVKRKVQFARDATGRKRMVTRRRSNEEADLRRVPRIARLMALAIRFDRLIGDGTVADQSELARLACVTQPRMTQIMNLLGLAPTIQEELLTLGTTCVGRDAITERQLRRLVGIVDWREQCETWRSLAASLLRRARAEEIVQR